MLAGFSKNSGDRGFAFILLPAALGGAVWSFSGLPLGWLMGAALVTGIFAMFGRKVTVPKIPHRAGLVIIGANVGLALTPEVAARMTVWAPVMVGASVLGIALAGLFAPVLSKFGRMSAATAYFSLLPGGVIEMSRIGGDHGADQTTIAALHTLRVGLVVVLLPVLLLTFIPYASTFGSANSDIVSWQGIALVIAVGALGGWIGGLVKLPAAWMLGPVFSVGLLAGSGVVEGRLHPTLSIVAQVVVGLALGARFERHRLASIPSALFAGLPTLLCIMTIMATVAVLVALFSAQSLSTLVLAFSIGGMAEMVLTAKALNQDIALVAAFQATRGIMVNALAGIVWVQLRKTIFSKPQKGE